MKLSVAPFISSLPLRVQRQDLIYDMMLDTYSIYDEITG